MPHYLLIYYKISFILYNLFKLSSNVFSMFHVIQYFRNYMYVLVNGIYYHYNTLFKDFNLYMNLKTSKNFD